MESQSLELSCSPQQEYGSLRGLHLYHRSAQSQTTLLSMAVNSEAKVDPQHRGRLQHSKGLDSLQVNVTISHLLPSDTGLYMWELSYREDSVDQIITSTQKVFLFVERTGMLFKHNATPTLTPSYLYSDFNSFVCLCREVMPVLSQLWSSDLDHLYNSGTSSAHTYLAGRREMCEYYFTQQRCRFNLMCHF